jgi:hypothetical protein
LAALLVVAALLVAAPIAQPAQYIHFADTRAWLGIPNAADVLSNLPFLLVGAWGLWQWPQWQRELAPCQRTAWGVFAVSIALTAFGSSLFHWQPNTDTITLDRLPIAWACSALLCAFLAERVNARWGAVSSVVLGVLIATAATLWWWWGERWAGGGDLRAYIAVQLLPMLLIPLGLLLRLRRDGLASRSRDAAWWWALGLYALAKLTEALDGPLLHATELVSGHTLKHLLAAGAAAALLHGAVQAARSAGRAVASR